MKSKVRSRGICLIGPLPKLPYKVGGPMVSFFNLAKYSQKNSECHCFVIDTARISYSIIRNLFASLKVLLKFALNRHRFKSTMINMSTNGMLTLGFFVFLLSKKSKTHIRFFGSSLEDFSQKKPNSLRLKYLFRAKTVFLQTKGLIGFFSKKFPEANIEWLPTSRLIHNNKVEVKANPKDKNKIRFVFAGHVSKAKGIGDLLSAIEILNTDSSLLNERFFEVDLYGHSGFDINLDEIEKTNNINYQGSQTSEYIMSVLPQYDALVFPSKYTGEGYPGIIIEAYLSGIPVITTRWRYIPEIVDENESGILINPSNPMELSKAMKLLIVNPDILSKMKNKAQEKGLKFDSNYWNKKVLNILCNN